MAGKVLAVATLAALTGVLNLASMSLTVLEGTRLLAQAGMTIPYERYRADNDQRERNVSANDLLLTCSRRCSTRRASR